MRMEKAVLRFIVHLSALFQTLCLVRREMTEGGDVQSPCEAQRQTLTPCASELGESQASSGSVSQITCGNTASYKRSPEACDYSTSQALLILAICLLVKYSVPCHRTWVGFLSLT